MAYGNYNNGYQNRGGYNRQQGGYNNGGGYNNQPQQQTPSQPLQTPEEFAKDRLNLFMVFLNEAETMGIKSDELINSGALGGWVTSYFMYQKNGR